MTSFKPAWTGQSWIGEMGIPVLLLILFGALTLPFVYKGVLSETDLAQMAFAVIHGQATGLHQNAGFHYGYSFSFGYYFVLYHFLSDSTLSDTKLLIDAINRIGNLSALAAIGLLGISTTRLYGKQVAALIVFTFAFNPMFLELSTSGHPELPAFCFLLLGATLLSYLNYDSIGMGIRSVVAILSALSFLAALCIRSDVALALPFVACATKPGVGSIRQCIHNVVPHIFIIAVAFLGFILLQKVATSEVTGESGKSALLNYLEFSNHLDLITKAFVVIILGTGILSLIVCALTIVFSGLKHVSLWEALTIGTLPIFSLLLWLPNPTPARHFIFLSLAVAFIVGITIGRRVSLPIAIAIGLLIAVGNQIAAELSYRFVVAHYPWSYPSLTERRATMAVPISSFIRNHRANEARLTYFRREGVALADSCKKTGKLLVIADEMYYYLLAIAEREPALQIAIEDKFKTMPVHAKGPQCETVVVTKYVAWPDDVLSKFISDPAYSGWPIYFQELTRGEADTTNVPIDRMPTFLSFEPALAGSLFTITKGLLDPMRMQTHQERKRDR